MEHLNRLYYFKKLLIDLNDQEKNHLSRFLEDGLRNYGLTKEKMAIYLDSHIKNIKNETPGAFDKNSTAGDLYFLYLMIYPHG